MVSQKPVRQTIDDAKLSLRKNAAQIDFFKPVKDNPVASLSAAFILGASSADSSHKKVSPNLLSLILKLSTL